MRFAIFLIGATCLMGQTVSTSDDPHPISSKERLQWVMMGMVGPQTLFAESVTSAFGTWTNSPREYGTHWDGWGKRIGLDVSTSALSHTLEAGVGAAWGEDPRYPRLGEGAFKSRSWNVIKMTVLARNRNGNLMPAYSRFIATPATEAISNAWRPGSQITFKDTERRIALDFLGRMAGNAWAEFWPDLKEHVFHKHQ